MPIASSLTGTELVPIVQDGVNKSVIFSALGQSAVTISSEGTGVSILDDASTPTNILLKSVLAGPNVTVTDDGVGDVVISASGGPLVRNVINVVGTTVGDSGYNTNTWTVNLTSADLPGNYYVLNLESLSPGNPTTSTLNVTINITDTPTTASPLYFSLQGIGTDIYPGFTKLGVLVSPGPSADYALTSVITLGTSGMSANQTASLAFIGTTAEESFLDCFQPAVSNIVGNSYINVTENNGTYTVDNYYFDTVGAIGTGGAGSGSANDTSASGTTNTNITNLTLAFQAPDNAAISNQNGISTNYNIIYNVNIVFSSGTYITLPGNSGNAPQNLSFTITSAGVTTILFGINGSNRNGGNPVMLVPYGFNSTGAYGGSITFVMVAQCTLGSGAPAVNVNFTAINNANINYNITFNPILGYFAPQNPGEA